MLELTAARTCSEDRCSAQTGGLPACSTQHTVHLVAFESRLVSRWTANRALPRQAVPAAAMRVIVVQAKLGIFGQSAALTGLIMSGGGE